MFSSLPRSSVDCGVLLRREFIKYRSAYPCHVFVFCFMVSACLSSPLVFFAVLRPPGTVLQFRPSRCSRCDITGRKTVQQRDARRWCCHAAFDNYTARILGVSLDAPSRHRWKIIDRPVDCRWLLHCCEKVVHQRLCACGQWILETDPSQIQDPDFLFNQTIFL